MKLIYKFGYRPMGLYKHLLYKGLFLPLYLQFYNKYKQYSVGTRITSQCYTV